MFGCSKYASEYYKIFSDVSKLKLMTFSIFFQRLTFLINTCQRLGCIQNPVEHSTMELYCEKCFFCKINKKTSVLESHFNKVTGLYPATSLKKGLQHRCFLMNFARYLRHSFYRTPPGDQFCSMEKKILSRKQ